MSILIVHSSATTRANLAQGFEEQGFDTVACGTLKEAAGALTETEFSLAVLDVLFPDGDGQGLLEVIRSHPSSTPLPVLVLSDDPLAVRETEAGDDVYRYSAVAFDRCDIIDQARAIANCTKPSAPIEKQTEPDKIRILLVDDSRTTLAGLRQSLESLGHELIEANSGEQALERLEQHDISVILLDVNMPGISGYETAQRIRQREKYQQTPILFITATEDEQEEILEGYASGAVDYVFKTIRPAVLRAKVKVFIELELAKKRIAELNTRLALAMKRVRVADQLKSEFLSMASHDLKSPLGTVLALIENMTDGLYGDRCTDLEVPLGKVKGQILSMSRLIENLLDLSALDQGMFKTEFRNVAVDAFLREIHESHLPVAQRKSIEFKIDIPDKLPEIWIDSIRVREILDNLISNAFKFCSNDLQVSLFAEASEMEVLIRVADSGPGIPEQEIGRLFERFSRTSTETSRTTTGSGLGLAIVQKNVELHGGRVWVESEEGQGATFCFTLPRDRRGTQEACTARILVVDDQPQSHQLLHSLIEKSTRHDCTILQVRSGTEALEFLQRHEVDVIFSELEMPGIDGLTLLDKVQQTLPELPFVVMTDDTHAELVKTAMDRGAQASICKPFCIKEIRTVLDMSVCHK